MKIQQEIETIQISVFIKACYLCSMQLCDRATEYRGIIVVRVLHLNTLSKSKTLLSQTTPNALSACCGLSHLHSVVESPLIRLYS